MKIVGEPNLRHFITLLCWLIQGVMASESKGSFHPFELNIFKIVSRGDGNVFISPFSISAALSMLLCGAKDRTERELLTALSEKDSHALQKRFQSLLDSLKDLSKADVYIGNTVFANSDFIIRDEFQSLLKSTYAAETNTLDFTQPEAAAETINSWVKYATRGKINDIIPTQDITPDSKMFLINAVYFKGYWIEKFKEELTKPCPFHSVDGSEHTVDMMFMKKTVNFAENTSLKCKIIELLYTDEKLSMVIILPDNVRTFRNFEKSLTTKDLDSLLHSMVQTKVEIWMPKFKFEESYSLKDAVQELGSGIIFSREADFSGISEETGLFVDKIIHKAFIEVNEEGTEAAAATSVKIMKRSLEILPDFKADRPFFFFIIQRQNKTVLFAGAFKKPTSIAKHDEL